MQAQRMKTQGMKQVLFILFLLVGLVIIVAVALNLTLLMQNLLWILLIAVFLFIIWKYDFVLMLTDYERAVIFRFGKVKRVGGPGWAFILPGVEEAKIVDLRTLTIDVPKQDVVTKDGIELINDKPHAAAGQHFRVDENLIYGNAEAQSGNGQIWSLQSQRRKTHHNAEQSCRQTGTQKAYWPWDAETTEMPEGESADGQKPRLAKRDLPGVTDEQVLPLDPDGVDADDSYNVGDVFRGIPGQHPRPRRRAQVSGRLAQAAGLPCRGVPGRQRALQQVRHAVCVRRRLEHLAQQAVGRALADVRAPPAHGHVGRESAALARAVGVV